MQPLYLIRASSRTDVSNVQASYILIYYIPPLGSVFDFFLHQPQEGCRLFEDTMHRDDDIGQSCQTEL